MSACRRLVSVVVAAPLIATVMVVAQDAATLQEIPAPNLAEADPAIRQQSAKILERIDELRASAGDVGQQLADAYGHLGQVYLLYQLYEAAEPAFHNAAVLAANDLRWSYYLATVLQQTNRLEGTVLLLERIHEGLPGETATVIRLGRTEVALGHLERARHWFDIAMKLEPNSAAAHAGLGEIASLEHDWADAVSLLEIALELQPEATMLHHQLGLAYRGTGDLDAARRHLELRGPRVVSFPDLLISELTTAAPSASVFASQGLQAQARGDVTKAIGLYRRALELDENNLRARRSLLAALAREESYDAALEQAEWLMEHDPDDLPARFNTGLIHAGKQDLVGALPYLQAVVEQDPDFTKGHMNLAAVYRAMGRPAEAETHYSRALELDPNNLQTRLDRGLNRVDNGQIEAAKDDLEAVLQRDPDHAAALIASGRLLVASGDPEMGRARLEQALETELTPLQRGATELEIGSVQLASGSPQNAVSHLEQAARLLPEQAEAHTRLAVALGQLQQFSAAAASYQRALEIDPADQSAWFGRTIALLLAEEYSQAREHLEATVQKWPSSLPFQHVLARFLAACPRPDLRDGARALSLTQQIVAAEQTLDHGRTMAMAMAETGSFDDARRLGQILLEQAGATGNAAMVAALEGDLKLYVAGEPVRAPWLPQAPR